MRSCWLGSTCYQSKQPCATRCQHIEVSATNGKASCYYTAHKMGRDMVITGQVSACGCHIGAVSTVRVIGVRRKSDEIMLEGRLGCPQAALRDYHVQARPSNTHAHVPSGSPDNSTAPLLKEATAARTATCPSVGDHTGAALHTPPPGPLLQALLEAPRTLFRTKVRRAPTASDIVGPERPERAVLLNTGSS